MASLMPLLMKWESEADLSDEQFHAIARFAASPPPVLPRASPDELREMIAFLAGSLKAPRTGVEAGKIKLGAYRLALADQPKAALTHAVQVAIRTMEWLPAPAELLKIAEGYCGPEKLAHSRARRLARDRRQRLFEERCKAIRSRAIPPDEFHTLTDQEIRFGISHRALLRELDGTVILWTLEDENRIIAERMAQFSLEGPPLSPHDERDKRAEDGDEVGGNRARSDEAGQGEVVEPKTGKRAPRASVGEFTAGIMAGMEVSDGEA